MCATSIEPMFYYRSAIRAKEYRNIAFSAQCQPITHEIYAHYHENHIFKTSADFFRVSWSTLIFLGRNEPVIGLHLWFPTFESFYFRALGCWKCLTWLLWRWKFSSIAQNKNSAKLPRGIKTSSKAIQQRHSTERVRNDRTYRLIITFHWKWLLP